MVSVDVFSVVGLLNAAEKFDLECLKNACWEFVVSCIRPDLVHDLIALSNEYSNCNLTNDLFKEDLTEFRNVEQFQVQKYISEYLSSISCHVHTMHEFCDGCSCQYKSRHCLGHLRKSLNELGNNNLIRNFFETFHAKGPQDAAGGLVKNQTDLAIVRGTATIQNAHDLFEFAKSNLSVPKSKGNINECENTNIIGTFSPIPIVPEIGTVDEVQTDETDIEVPIYELVSKSTIFAVLCDDNRYQ
ncbi:unnamed protein product [Mytilus coruscus]|uniref:Uncharacterized protein n=1 Tax=Mytilus coruscus TaxID=42192 RepID=A0A6J8CXK5_MYTCO|nr:unnamed protein product [Mytilus coruscus]